MCLCGFYGFHKRRYHTPAHFPLLPAIYDSNGAGLAIDDTRNCLFKARQWHHVGK